MKVITSLAVVILFFLFTSQSFSQFWEYQTSATTEILNGVYMIDSQTGWVVGDAGTLLNTTNQGTLWTQVNVTANDLNSIIFIDANTGIAVGDDGTIIRTTDGGTSWQSVSSGTSEQFRKLAASGGFIYAAGDNGVFASSSDNGATWQLKSSGTTTRFRSVSASGSNKVWAAGNDGLIRYSSDNGNSWATQTSGLTNDDLQDIQFVTESIGFAGASGNNFLYTSNGGTTWTLRNSGVFSDMKGIYFQDENIGWGVSIVGTVYFTTDGGQSWTSQPCGSSFTLNEAHFVHQGRGWTVGDGGTLIMYNNPTIPVELNSFSASVTGSSVTLNWITSTETNNLGFEIQRSDVRGQKSPWTKVGFVDGRGTTTELQSYSFTDENLSAGSYNYRIKQIDFDGSFKFYDLAETVEIGAPEEFVLEQNYPNPFNPATKIRYEIPDQARNDIYVQIKVYDVLGNEVTTLVNDVKPAGSYEVEFNSSSIPSGTYFYQLKAGNFSETKKMILVK